MKTTSILLIGIGLGTGVFADDEANALRNRNDEALRALMQSSAVTQPDAEPEVAVPAPVATVALPTPAPLPADPTPAPVVAEPEAQQLQDLQRRLEQASAAYSKIDVPVDAVVARRAPTAAPTAVPAAAPVVAPVLATADAEPKKRGFFSRVFGGGSADQSVAAEPTPIAPPTTGPLGAVAGNLPSRPSVDAGKIRENRNALEDMIAQSRDEVTRRTTAGENEVIGGQEVAIDFEMDPDAWKKAGPKAWKYQGEWANGTFEGQGQLMYADGWAYQGAFQNGTMEGMGTLNLPDGTKYEGLWKAGEMHGVGKLTYPDGWVFVGQWRDGKISGRGTLVHPGE